MRNFTLLALALLSAAPANLAAQPSAYYLGGSAHYYRPDHDRSSATGSGGTLFVGIPLGLFAGRASLELAGFGSSVSEDAPNPDFSVYGLELDLRAILAEEASYSTFLLAGVGASRNDQFKQDSRGFVTGGFGLLLPLGTSGWSLRNELRMYAQRTDAATAGEDLLFDYRAGFGLEYSFAEAAPAPRPAPTPAPAARPEPAPVVPPAAAPVMTDSDGDGIIDPRDRCPDTAPGAAVDDRGCTRAPADSDQDGIADDMDRCPDTPAGAAIDAFGCPLLLDADGDGIVDARDRCADTPPGVAVDFQGCASAPNPDADGDGVLNESDRCPDTPPQMRVDGRGCVVQQSVNFSNITFEFNSSALTAGAKGVLDRIAGGLKRQGELQVEISGHTDAIGTPEQNLPLSRQRAQTVLDYLVARGVGADRLSASGYGESRPVASNDTESGRARNRRVEFKIRR